MPRWLAVSLGVPFAVAPLLLTFLLYRNTSTFLATARRVPGTVTKYELVASTDSEGTSSMYHAVVTFNSGDGRPHQFQDRTGFRSPGISGEVVEVLYDPRDPSDARTYGFFSLWGGTLIFGALALICIMVIGLMFRMGRQPGEA